MELKDEISNLNIRLAKLEHILEETKEQAAIYRNELAATKENLTVKFGEYLELKEKHDTLKVQYQDATESLKLEMGLKAELVEQSTELNKDCIKKDKEIVELREKHIESTTDYEAKLTKKEEQVSH